MKRWLAALALVAGCSDNSAFTLGRDLDVCDGNFPSCDGAARCVLDDSHYITGDFPSARRFIIRTMGEASLDIQILLTNERSPGTELRLTLYEPGCGDEYVYDTSGRDLFRATSTDGILDIPMHVTRAGDHLAELISDSYCTYTLEWSNAGSTTSMIELPAGQLPGASCTRSGQSSCPSDVQPAACNPMWVHGGSRSPCLTERSLAASGGPRVARPLLRPGSDPSLQEERHEED